MCSNNTSTVLYLRFSLGNLSVLKILPKSNNYLTKGGGVNVYSVDKLYHIMLHF